MKIFWGLACTLVLLMNCGKPPQTSQYSLSLPEPESLDQHSSIRAVRVAPLQGESPYHQDHLIYKMNSMEYRYDPYRFWIAPPVDHVRDHLIKYLRHTGLFQWVDGSVPRMESIIHLEITLLSFEEVYTDAGREAQVAIWVQIYDSDSKPVWTGAMDNHVPIKDSGAVGVVKAINSATKNVFEKLLAKLESI